MFGLLKNKISGFLSALTKKGEGTDAVQGSQEAKKPESQPPAQDFKAEQPQQNSSFEPQATQEKPTFPPDRKPDVIASVEKKENLPSAKKIESVSEKLPEKDQQARKAEHAAKAAPQAKEKMPVPIARAEKIEKQEIKQPPYGKIATPQTPHPETLVAPVQKPAEKRQEEPRPAQTIPKTTLQKIPIKPSSRQIPNNPFAQTEQPPVVVNAQELARIAKKAAAQEESARKVQPKLGIVSSIASIFSNNVTIKENDLTDLLDTLELSLLEGDVAFEVSQDIVSMLRMRLVGKSVPKSEFGDTVKSEIKGVLVEVMSASGNYDLYSKAKTSKKPFKVLFVGPNGAGKTTTMAKLARHFMDMGLSVVFAASDTFRAAAIEQLEVHAQRLGIKVIKNQYGSDPASVAFDAIKYAESHSIDIVLIDSSGRQDTNANLLAELKKIVRIANPDSKIYIGESIAGNATISQVGAFKETIGLDAVILTKLDCDPKGGSALSISKATGVPIIFVGVGQTYTDLKPFSPQEIASELVAS